MNDGNGSTTRGTGRIPQIKWLRRGCIVLILAIGAGGFEARAQQVSAQLTGVVTDSSGAVMPGVSLEVKSLTSNDTYRTQTDEHGRYSFLTLPADQYQIEATKQSFKTLERTMQLTVDQAANLNLVMTVGSRSDVVLITAAEAPLVNATNSTVGTVIEQKEIADLPLNGRNFATLITLTPGVSTTDVSQEGSGPAIQGQRNRDNSYQADGVNIATMTDSQIVMTPPLDSVQEFRVQSVNGDAQFGQSGGGFVNLVTKSGTNHLSGSIYDYFRNSDLDARDFFQPTLPKYQQNQYGFSVGGPVVFPKLLPLSKTKTYFFLSYEGLRLKQNGSTLGIVPTAAQLAGNFSGFNPIYNPFSTVPDPNKPGSYLRTLFPANNIANMINPTALSYAMAYFPAPNYSAPKSPDNFINNSPSFTNKDTWMGRIDLTINNSNRVSVRWLQANQTTGSTLPVGSNLQSGSIADPRNLSIEWNSILSPTTLITFRYGYSRSDLVSQGPLVPSYYNSSGFSNPNGFPLNTPGYPLLPAISITNYTTFLSQGYSPTIDDSNVGTIDAQRLWGKHAIKIGISFNRLTSKNGGLDPVESFNPAQTENLESPTGTGDGFASFLLGVPTSAGRLIGTPLANITANFYGTYVQDTIRVNQRLNVSVGLRWDHAGRFGTNGALGSFDQATGNTWLLTAPVDIPGAVFQGPNIGSGILDPVYTDFGPRAGFAYQLRPRLVVRAGYGLFFDTVAGRWQWVQGPRVAWPRAVFQSTPPLNVNTVQVSLTNPFVGLPSTEYVTNPFLNTNGTPAYPTGTQLNPNYLTPRVNEFNLAFEQQLSDKLVASATYVGAMGQKLECCGLVNFAYTNGPTTYDLAPRPWPMMGIFRTDENNGYSNYNALELKVQQNPVHGLNFLAGYTYSKSTDLGCSGYIGAEGCNQTQPYHLVADHALSDFDLRNIANFSAVYELPFGRERMFSVDNRVVDLIAGGWQVSGIFTLHSGLPMTAVEANSAQTNIGSGVTPRPDLVGSTKIATQSRFEFFNIAAFANPSGYDYGTAGRNILHGPMNHAENISLFKTFSLFPAYGREVHLQYRADLFNAFNTTVYGDPGLTLGTTTFGVISSASAGRIIQMALRISF